MSWTDVYDMEATAAIGRTDRGSLDHSEKQEKFERAIIGDAGLGGAIHVRFASEMLATAYDGVVSRRPQRRAK